MSWKQKNDEQQVKQGNKGITKMKEVIQSGSTKEIFAHLSQEESKRRSQELDYYYVPYNVTALQDGFDITVFPVESEDSIQLAIKYEINHEKQTIILANTNERDIRFDSTKRQIEKYFAGSVQNFTSLREIEPEFYIEYLERHGWTLTQEGLDLFCTVKNDGEVEIKRTEFTSNELASITDEQIKDNRMNHIFRRESQVIGSIPDYIVKSYQMISEGNIKQALSNEKLIEQYGIVKEYIANTNQDNELAKAFTNMKPVLHDQEGIEQETQQYIEVISNCIRQIPEQYRDRIQHQRIFQYMIIRRALIQEKQKGTDIRQDSTMLDDYIKRIDKKEMKKQQKARDTMEESVAILRKRHQRGTER